MAVINLLILSFIATTSPDSRCLCEGHGRLAYVDRREDADVRIRFVEYGEDVRIRFRNRPTQDGEWRVVGRNERPDVRVFVEQRGGPNIVDVDEVAYGPRCM